MSGKHETLKEMVTDIKNKQLISIKFLLKKIGS